VLGRLAHHVEAHPVVDHQHVRIGHEQLEAGHALVPGERAQIGERLRERIEDDHMGADVDAAALAAPVPVLEARKRALPVALVREVDHRCGAAERRGLGAGAESVDRARTAELPVQMGVHVDRPRHHHEAARIVDFDAALGRQILPQHPHLAVLDPDVADVVVDRRDDPAALDQGRHVFALPARSSCEITAAAREGEARDRCPAAARALAIARSRIAPAPTGDPLANAPAATGAAVGSAGRYGRGISSERSSLPHRRDDLTIWIRQQLLGFTPPSC
jgi:hypothetical protein